MRGRLPSKWGMRTVRLFAGPTVDALETE